MRTCLALIRSVHTCNEDVFDVDTVVDTCIEDVSGVDTFSIPVKCVMRTFWR